MRRTCVRLPLGHSPPAHPPLSRPGLGVLTDALRGSEEHRHESSRAREPSKRAVHAPEPRPRGPAADNNGQRRPTPTDGIRPDQTTYRESPQPWPTPANTPGSELLISGFDQRCEMRAATLKMAVKNHGRSCDRANRDGVSPYCFL